MSRSQELVHLEVLGPRETLDQWLGTLQSLGSTHVADAMRGLEGIDGIARPAPTSEELESDVVRGEALRLLQAVERVLPPAHTIRATHGPLPDWELGPGHMHRGTVGQDRKEAEVISKRLRATLEALQQAESGLEKSEGLFAGFRALERAGESTVSGHVYVVRGGLRRARALQRRFKKLGLLVSSAAGHRCHAVVLRASAKPTEEAERAAIAYAATLLPMPEDMRGVPLAKAREQFRSMRDKARGEEREARAALATAVLEVGERGRFLWSSLRDAEERRWTRHRLASTHHVVAARIFTRAEDEEALRASLHAAHGAEIVVRPLELERDDAPTPVRQVAALPLSAIAGFTPATLGRGSVTAALSTLAPLAVAAVWCDMGGGILLALLGAVLWFSAKRGSPRRDVAWMALSAGVAAMFFGALAGRAFGTLGDSLWGSGWGQSLNSSIRAGLGSSMASPLGFDMFRGTALLLGWVALACAAWAALCGLIARFRSGRAREPMRASLELVTVAGVALLVWSWPAQYGHAALSWWHASWIAAPLAVILWLDRGKWPLLRLLLEATVMLRLIAVGSLAALLTDHAFASLAAGGLAGWLLAPIAVSVGLLAMVADPAHVAIGLPYDIAFGARGLSRPFKPFQRSHAEGPSKRAGVLS